MSFNDKYLSDGTHPYHELLVTNKKELIIDMQQAG